MSTITETYYGSMVALYETNVDYGVARTSASGHIAETYCNVGQLQGFQIYRIALLIDTSAIPDGATIDSAILYLYTYADNSNTDFDVVVQNGQPTYPHNPTVEGDYDQSNYSGNGGSLSSNPFVLYEYKALTLNADGRSWINKTGVTKLLLRSSRDISATQPTNNEVVQFLNYPSCGPYLVIQYESGGIDVDIEVPLVTLSDITPLIPIPATGGTGFTSIPQFHVKQLVYDHDLNTYLKNNLTYLKTLEESGQFDKFSDHISWVSPNGFNLGSYPAQSVFGGISLTMTGSGEAVTYPAVHHPAIVRSNGYLYKVLQDKQTAIDFTLYYIDISGNWQNEPSLYVYLASTDSWVTAQKVGVSIWSGAILSAAGHPLCPTPSDGTCFLSIRAIYNPGNWCKYFINNTLIWTETYPSTYLPSGTACKLFIQANGGISETLIEAEPYYETTFYDSVYKISRVLITQEY